ncbi:hypothetical protein [uncultured Mailhella sp.]|uniref:hypothetical protein n=1 Tax=uncultured Mailhella sp. TaxID=1981031 RepID=UPI0025DD90CF|nr:hypothetical protein [uncultured Mailhella sp.]
MSILFMPLAAQFENKVKENKNMQFLCNVMQLLSVCTFFEKSTILRIDARKGKKEGEQHGKIGLICRNGRKNKKANGGRKQLFTERKINKKDIFTCFVERRARHAACFLSTADAWRRQVRRLRRATGPGRRNARVLQ